MHAKIRSVFTLLKHLQCESLFYQPSPSSSLLLHFHVSIACFQDCDQGEIRLAGTASSWMGRVEMCYDGVWGTMCSIGWDVQEATVVCRQLGFSATG